MDISDTLAPNSDQLDAVELVSGPRTFTIERVTRGNDEQPVQIHFSDFPRPWRPGKSMRRVLVASWGPDAAAYVGRRITLYCDPDVVFGGQAVGGTRIAALSHIDKVKKVSLLVSRGKSAIFTVQPLADAPAPAKADTKDAITNEQIEKLAVLFRQAKIDTKDAGLAYIGDTIDRVVASSRDLTRTEADKVIESLELDAAEPVEPTLPDGAA